MDDGEVVENEEMARIREAERRKTELEAALGGKRQYAVILSSIPWRVLNYTLGVIIVYGYTRRRTCVSHSADENIRT